ncbi:MAG: hypothetical protein ACXWQO_06945 [Bdellovibrionota bacterium]
MHWKRSAQQLIRSAKGPSSWSLDTSSSIKTPAPQVFNKALFNFTVDFELFWGNGNLGGRPHSLERRIAAARRQAENFFPFLEMLKKIEFPVSWAVLGCMVDPWAEMEKDARFQPAWEREDWYGLPESVKSEKPLWDGKAYFDAIKAEGLHEVLSHGYAHIDYADASVNEKIAWNDILLSRKLLEKSGLSPAGFVFPCNAFAHAGLVKKAGFRISRGPDKEWHFQDGQAVTPTGFWISPGVCSFRDMKAIVQEGIRRKAFIHPWMHLIECELKCRDINDFYLPLFSLIQEEQAKGTIQNISFREIADQLLPEPAQ